MIFPLLLISLSIRHAVAQHQDELSCACALERSNQTVSCTSDNADLVTAMQILQTNDCGNSCLNDICQNAFYLVQAHHDYCFFNELPGTLSTIFHSFETKCIDCSIIRKNNPALQPCPAANCENDSGKIAFEVLASSDCQKDCSTKDCTDSFQYLRAVYDVCPDGTLDLIAELAVNDYDAPCAPYDCNTGAAETTNDLMCNPDEFITRPPAIPPPTQAPVPNVCFRLPDETIGDEPSCQICGDNQCITKPNNVFAWPQRPDISCKDLQDAGLQGYISFDQCTALPALAKPTCGCQPVDSYIEYAPPTVAPPIVKDDVNEPTTEKNSNLGMGIGVVVGVIILIAVIAFVLVKQSQTKKSNKHESAEIEVPEMKQPKTEQELA